MVSLLKVEMVGGGGVCGVGGLLGGVVECERGGGDGREEDIILGVALSCAFLLASLLEGKVTPISHTSPPPLSGPRLRSLPAPTP